MQSDANFSDTSEPSEATAGTAAPEEAEDSSENTALLPKALFGGDCKVGDTYTVKVVAVHEDELEVEPAGEDKTDKGEGSEMESAQSRMDSYAKG